MTKIIFNFNVYYISDQDTFFIEPDTIDGNDLVILRIFQNGVGIVRDTYKCLDAIESDMVMSILGGKRESDLVDYTQFNIYFDKKGECKNE